MIGRGVGRSGSPTPRLITSRPAARAAFFFRSISANRYGGSFWRRSAFANEVVDIAESWRNGAPRRPGGDKDSSRRADAASPGSGRRGFGDVLVGVNILDILILLEDVQELQHLLAV